MGNITSGGDTRDVDPQVPQEFFRHGTIPNFLAHGVNEVFRICNPMVNLSIGEYDDAVSIEEAETGQKVRNICFKKINSKRMCKMRGFFFFFVWQVFIE